MFKENTAVDLSHGPKAPQKCRAISSMHHIWTPNIWYEEATQHNTTLEASTLDGVFCEHFKTECLRMFAKTVSSLWINYPLVDSEHLPTVSTADNIVLDCYVWSCLMKWFYCLVNPPITIIFPFSSKPIFSSTEHEWNIHFIMKRDTNNAYIHTHTRTYIHNVHTYIHTYTHTYIHTMDQYSMTVIVSTFSQEKVLS